MGSPMRLHFYLTILFAITTTSACAADHVIPDPKLTPGAAETTDTALICQPGYSRTVRHTSQALKHKVYIEYGIDKDLGNYEIDHLIPLGIGGADVRNNLWPESQDTSPWNAELKDQLEHSLHAEICASRIQITDAQKAISTDWIAAYRRFLGEP